MFAVFSGEKAKYVSPKARNNVSSKRPEFLCSDLKNYHGRKKISCFSAFCPGSYGMTNQALNCGWMLVRVLIKKPMTEGLSSVC